MSACFCPFIKNSLDMNMNTCGGRIYKGEDISVSIPFALSGYTNLSVSYFTNGEVSVERTEEQLVIDGGYIIADFDNTELDILEDGVLRYTITCKVDGEDYVYSNNTPYYLKTPKDYDAKTAEEVWEDGYESGYSVSYSSGYTDGYAEGEVVGKAEGYVSGYTQGEATQKAKLIATAITENGIYEKEDGFNNIEVDIPSDFPAGYSSGYTDGSSDGYNRAIGDIRNNAIVLNVTENGVYSANTEDSVYFKEVDVNVEAPELLNKTEQMTATTQTFLPDMVRPYANGRYVYGGLLSVFEAVWAQYIDIRIMTWDDYQHSDWTLLGAFRIIEETGEAGYVGSSYNTPFTSCTTQWTQVDEYWNTKVWVYYDGYNVFFNIQGNFRYGYALASPGGYIFTDDELTFPTKAYYGMSALTVDASNVFNSGYTSGQTEAVNNWYEGFLDGMFTSGHTYPSDAGVIYLKEEHLLKYGNKSLMASGTAEVSGAVVVSDTTRMTSEQPDRGFSYIKGGSYDDWTSILLLIGQTIPAGTYEYKYNVSFANWWGNPAYLKPDRGCGFICDSSNWSSAYPTYTSAGYITSRKFYFE